MESFTAFIHINRCPLTCPWTPPVPSHIKPYLPLLCGHNAQALSKQKHEPGQMKEILQMQEGTTFANDMTNYWIHTF